MRQINLSPRFAVSPWLSTIVLALCVLVCPSCSSDRGQGIAEGELPPASVPQQCAPGQQRACAIELGTRDGITDCLSGTQSCDSGSWSPCAPSGTTPQTFAVPAPPPKPVSMQTRVLSGSSTQCDDNPCDPYCSKDGEEPPGGVTEPPEATIVGTTGGSLASSNNPPAFKDKGSLNDRCTVPCNTKSCMEACQFDQHCGTLTNGAPGCVPFTMYESGACEGVDITAPVTCLYPDGSRSVTVCNRGTVPAPLGVSCYVFRGGSPQYPDDAPSLTHAGRVMTTATALAPGACESQIVPASAFPNEGILSMMCNPPGSGVGGVMTPTWAGPNYPSNHFTSTWNDAARGYAADGQYAFSDSFQTLMGYNLPTAVVSSAGWNSTSNALGDDGLTATASPPMSGLLQEKLPTSNTNAGWTNPERAYLAGDSLDATAAPALPGSGAAVSTGALFPKSNTGNSCTGGAACTWQNPNNAYAMEVPPAFSRSYATANLSKGVEVPDQATIYFGGFDFSAMPDDAVIDAVTVSTMWYFPSKVQASVQPMKGGALPIGTPISKTGWGGNTLSVDSATSSFAPGAMTTADLKDPRFIRVSAIRDGSGGTDTIYIDYITVNVTYRVPGAPNTQTVEYKNFGLAVPAGATITGLTTEVRWRTSTANSNFTLGLQPYKAAGASPAGSEYTTTATAALGAYTVATHALDNASLAALTADDLSDANFRLRLRATRSYSPNTPNPNVTAYVDYVKVTVTYVFGDSNSTFTLGNFGLNVPDGVTVLHVTTEVKWNTDIANERATLGVQPFTDGGATPIGTQLTTAGAPPTTPTVVTAVASSKAGGVPLSPADLTDGNFVVKLWTNRNPDPINNPDFTAHIDYVRVQVAYVTPSTKTVSYGGFGLNMPPNRDLYKVILEVKWKISTANPNAVLGVQGFKDVGVTPVGTEVTTPAGSTPPTIDTVVSTEMDVSSLYTTDLLDPNFFIRVRASRTNYSDTNPDFLAYIDYVTVKASYLTVTGGNLTECNPHNNWSATKASPEGDVCQDIIDLKYQPFTVTRVFDGTTCPPSTRIRWKSFSYGSTTPLDSNIKFRFRTFEPSGSPATCAAQPAAITDPPVALAVAQSTPTDTQVCKATSGTPGCPVDLLTGLGGLTAASTPCLQMDARAEPASDDLGTATLLDWSVTYDCIPAE